MRRFLVAAVVSALAVVCAPSPAEATTDHDRLVSDNPVDGTPEVLDGEVHAIVPVGERIVVGGSFTGASSPAP